MRDEKQKIRDVFEDIEDKIAQLSQEAGVRAARLVRKDLEAIHKDYPNHTFEFWTGAYSPYLLADPPLHGVNKFHHDDIDDGPRCLLSHVAGQKKMQVLRERLERMTEIVIHTEDTFKVDIGYVTMTGGCDLDADAENNHETDAPTPG